ncbi:putative ABC transporter ATP-binding protein YxlF [Ruminiclostridium hungatei]|uniref:Putative ABC transporter ATP-binding protein YxlF n=1 Tax=Ruminiclostridium hungatei TaxID=48256 RepID=A0A1V4SQB3_RUMHU|nr:ABC transporter ATP-binding protein [Ruminiclostridium hungatei]OPX45963.1 putative ABC transporter ATP-binding protein YxlF [Ruminiclostridium hungatei]
MEPIIRIENLSKTIKRNPIVEHMNLEIYQGDVFGLFGPSGAGKTTIVKLMAGKLTPTQGRIIINGYDIKTDKKEAVKCLGAVIDPPKFYNYLSGHRNLSISAGYTEGMDERIKEIIEIVGLNPVKDNKVSVYSLCMKQKLAIARAFLKRPKVLILDEPIHGMDLQGVVEIRNLIKELAYRENITLFLTSHIRDGIENICTRTASIYDGRLEIE